MARISGDLYCAWQQSGNVTVARDSGRTQLGSFPGGNPSFAASPDGKEGYLVWEAVEGDHMATKFAVLR
jgi:hypothetical protein